MFRLPQRSGLVPSDKPQPTGDVIDPCSSPFMLDRNSTLQLLQPLQLLPAFHTAWACHSIPGLFLCHYQIEWTKKIPRYQKDSWGRSLDAVQAASIIASARASIITLVCLDYQLRLPLLRHADGRSWTSLGILSASRLVQDRLVTYVPQSGSLNESKIKGREYPCQGIGIDALFFPTLLYYHRLFHTTFQGSRECHDGGEEEGDIDPSHRCSKSYNIQCTMPGGHFLWYISPVVNWMSIRDTKLMRSSACCVNHSRYRIHAHLMPYVGFSGSQTRPIPLQWFKECARYVVFILATEDTSLYRMLSTSGLKWESYRKITPTVHVSRNKVQTYWVGGIPDHRLILVDRSTSCPTWVPAEIDCGFNAFRVEVDDEIKDAA